MPTIAAGVIAILRSIFLKTLRDQRRALFWWVIGLSGLALYIMLFYPSIGESPELSRLLQDAPPAVRVLIGESDFTSPAGYVNAELFFFMAPLLFLFLTVSQGSYAIAGEEERGTLDLLLANPLRRRRVVIEKFAALVIATLIVAFIFWVGLSAGARIAGVDLSLVRMAEATLSAVLLGIAFGTLALALSCASGRRGLSTGVTSALAVLAYFLNSLAPLVKQLQPYRKLSLFYYYISADPLRNGLDPGHAALLLGLAIVFLVIGIAALERRDLGV